jgi:3-hydroxyisobutyrate dehydrogenase
MKVGFIGLGIMGASFASNLQKAGYQLIGHDLSRQIARRHLDAGATWAETPRALAELFSAGVKAGVEPLALWEAVRQGAHGRRRTFDGLADHFLVDR